MAEIHKTYLEYLDKEMSIMGVLCAFSVGVLALALDRILGNEKETTLTSLWRHDPAHVLTGSALVLASALMFYRQRSLLAWYYGQISLSLIRPNRTGGDVAYWLKEADSWATWITYRIGWDCLTLAMLTFVAALIDAAIYPKALPVSLLWLPIVLWGGFEIPHLLVLRAYRYKNNPRREALKIAWKKLSPSFGRRSPPSDPR
jgi:hypothetical protein